MSKLGRFSQSRRAFTLLEVVLATVIGSMVLLSALAVFRVLDSAERSMQSRFETVQETAIAHRAIQRSMILI